MFLGEQKGRELGSCNCKLEPAAHLIKNKESQPNFWSKFPLISTCSSPSSSSPTQVRSLSFSPSTLSLSRQIWSNFGSNCYFRRRLKSPDISDVEDGSCHATFLSTFEGKKLDRTRGVKKSPKKKKTALDWSGGTRVATSYADNPSLTTSITKWKERAFCLTLESQEI